MYSYPVTYPLESLLGSHRKKDLKTTLSIWANPVLIWIFWIGFCTLLFPMIWRAIVRYKEGGGLQLVLNSENWSSLIYTALLVNAAALLLFVVFLFNLSMTKHAIRLWKSNTVPTAKEYGVSDGLHFGNGTIEIEENGITLVRNHYRGLFHWRAISDFFSDGSFIGLTTTDGTKVDLGFAQDDDKAHQFLKQATKHHRKALSQT